MESSVNLVPKSQLCIQDPNRSRFGFSPAVKEAVGKRVESKVKIKEKEMVNDLRIEMENPFICEWERED